MGEFFTFRGQWYEGVKVVYINFQKSRGECSPCPPLCSPGNVCTVYSSDI